MTRPGAAAEGADLDWYYVHGQERVGPLDDETFQRRVDEGTVSPATLVWNNTLADWQPYGKFTGLTPDSPDISPTSTVPLGTCVECGKSHPVTDLLVFDGTYVCGACKADYFQRVAQGTPRSVGVEYGSFWRRFGAKVIDYTLIGVFVVPFSTLVHLTLQTSPVLYFALTALLGITNFAVSVFYETYLVGSRGATFGKIALGLKVVVADGSKVSYARALGRAFAEIVSGIVLYVGYIMAAFDTERRTLHDYMCNTRVIRT